MAIAMLAIALLENVTATGFRQALIQRKGDIRSHLDTAWTIELIRNSVLAGLLIGFSSLIADFFDAPPAGSIVRVIALALLVDGFANIATVYFEKELEFRRRFVFMATPSLADAIVGIGVALVIRDVWALVFGMLAASITRVIVSYVIHSYRPRLTVDRRHARELYTFGKWVFLSSIVIYLLNNLDYVVVGKILGITALGFYRMAYNFSQVMATELTTVTSQVAFPAYSMIWPDTARLRKAYLATLNAIALISFPMAMGIILIANEGIAVLLGTEWLPMVPVLQILAVAGLSQSVASTTTPLFNAVGRPDLVTKLSFTRLVLLGALIYPLAQWRGLVGPAYAVAASTLLVHSVSLRVATRVLGLELSSLVKQLAHPALHAGLMLVVVNAARPMLTVESGVLTLGLLVVSGAMIYVLGMIASVRFLGYDREALPLWLFRMRSERSEKGET